MYTAPPLSKIRYCYFMDTTVNSAIGALRKMMRKKIQPFVPKSGDSINCQPNDNGPNTKLRSLYNVVKSACLMKYVMKRFSPHHMNSALVEVWDAFKMSARNIIRDRFAKNILPPLIPTDLTKNAQACAAFVQVSSGEKA